MFTEKLSKIFAGRLTSTSDLSVENEGILVSDEKVLEECLKRSLRKAVKSIAVPQNMELFMLERLKINKLTKIDCGQ